MKVSFSLGGGQEGNISFCSMPPSVLLLLAVLGVQCEKQATGQVQDLGVHWAQERPCRVGKVGSPLLEKESRAVGCEEAWHLAEYCIQYSVQSTYCTE